MLQTTSNQSMICAHYSSVSSSGSTASSSDWFRVTGFLHASPPSHRQKHCASYIGAAAICSYTPRGLAVVVNWLKYTGRCLMGLFVVTRCPGGRVPSHDLLDTLSVVIREVLLSMLRLAGDTI